LTIVDLPIQTVTHQEQMSVAVRLARYHRIVKCILQSCESIQRRGFRIQTVVIEGYAMSMSPGQANMASLLYELGGILRYALMTELKLAPERIIEISPTQAKKHWTGRGSATKQEMYDSFLYQGFFPELTWCLHAPRLQARLRTQHQKHPLVCKTYKPVEDLIDAWALLDCYWHSQMTSSS
jgi:Holliday junction resolvasome RuvABC endonuclease subunit